MISAIVLTKNEETNIEKCLQSISWCDEIIIVDDYSEDNTIESVKRQAESVKKEIKIYQRKLNADFAGQRNFGLEKANSEWVLIVDADEEISEELTEEILSICHSGLDPESHGILKQVQDDKVGYYLKRKDYFGGKWLNYGESSKIRLLRLARKGCGKWEGRVHEIWKVEGELGELKNPILHYPHPTVSEFLKEVNWYTDLVAQYWREQGRKMAAWEILVYPAGKFIQNYILRRGFMDGTAGFIMAAFMSFHSFSARSKYWLMTNF